MLTVDQFIVITKGLKEVYQRDKFLQTRESLDVWYNLLKDIDYPILSIAIQKYMLNNKFAPTPADIREAVLQVTTTENDWGEGWQQVIKSFGRYGMYRVDEALASFDEITRKCVERLGYKNLCMSENLANDRANFRMLYEQIDKSKKELARLPQLQQEQIKKLQEVNEKTVKQIEMSK